MKKAAATPTPSPPSAPRPCPHCKVWEVLSEDNFCALCGQLQVRIGFLPKRVTLISGLPKEAAKNVVFSNRDRRSHRLRLLADGKAVAGVRLDPGGALHLEPGGKAVVKVSLVETRLPKDFRRLEVPFRLQIDDNSHHSLPFPVVVLAGPRPRAVPEAFKFGRLEEGTVVSRRVRLENGGGIPLVLAKIETVSSVQLRQEPPLSLPARVAPGRYLEIPLIWDTTVEERAEAADRPGIELRFADHGETCFIPAVAKLFRRQLVMEPPRIQIAEGLQQHVFLESVRLVNRGTVDVQITAIESDVDWLEVLGMESFLLRAHTNSSGETVAPEASDLPVFYGARGFDVLCCPARLAVGKHHGNVLIRTDGLGETLTLEVEIEVIAPTSYPEYIGIDFGTTNSVLALFDTSTADGFELITEEDEKGGRSPLIPSILVFLGSLEAYCIGRRARNEIDTAADRAVRSIKRLLGSSREHLFYGEELSAAEIAARIIRRLLDLAERHLYATRGEYLAIERAIVTVPARFYGAQIKAILEACETAGLDIEEEEAHRAMERLREALGAEVNAGVILDEPSAAVLFYVHHLAGRGHSQTIERKIQRKKGLVLLVFDYGGGTLDVSVARILRQGTGPSMVTVLANDGNNGIGGDSIDLALMEYLVAQAREEFPDFDGELITANYASLEHRQRVEGWSTILWADVLAARNHWKDAAEQAKVALSQQSEVEVEVAGFDLVQIRAARLERGSGSFTLVLRQDTLDSLVADILAQAQELVERTVQLAGLSPKAVDYVFHTGRQSLMPAVRGVVRKVFSELAEEQDILDQEHLKVCVAQGAALYGSLRGGVGGGGIHFLNEGSRMPHRYGLDRSDGLTRRIFWEVIARGTSYPVEKTVVLPPDEIPAGGRLRLRVYQNTGLIDEILGNREVRLLGQLDVQLDHREDDGCKVRFCIDANRQLEVFANEQVVPIKPELEEEDEAWTW